jgi:hypothetical protein
MSKTHRNFSKNNNGKNRPHHNNKPNNGKRSSGNYVNPQQVLQKSKQAKEKYITMAREALAAGDRIEAENYFQHADHYTRVINSLNRERSFHEQENQTAAGNSENQATFTDINSPGENKNSDAHTSDNFSESGNAEPAFVEVTPEYQPPATHANEELVAVSA